MIFPLKIKVQHESIVIMRTLLWPLTITILRVIIVTYVTINEMSSNGTQTEHTRPTDTRASPRRCPPAFSSAGLSGDEHRCHSGGGGHFLEGDPLPPLCQQGGPLCRCPEPPDAGAAGLFRETRGPAHAP